MIHRECQQLIQKRLEQFDSVAILGPRQVGKTTLARAIAENLSSSKGDQPAARYLDLESPQDRRQLDDPEAYFSAYADQLIVLDEVQRMPEIFQVLRGQIDHRRRQPNKAGKFLILGSASRELLRQSSESLAGRVSFIELSGFNLREVLAAELAAEKNQSVDQVRIITDALWLKGGFPQSYLRISESESLQWRHDFIQAYLERDVPQLGLRVDAEQLGLFWRMLANDQGELFNAQRYARSIGINGHTVARYLDILEKLLLVRSLSPWSVNTGKRLVKSPRLFVRDSGILHALLNLSSNHALRSHAVCGKSWEGFVIEALINATAGKARPYFYRTAAGAEVDLVLEFAPGQCWAIEIKLSSSPTLDRGFHLAADDVNAQRRLLVYKGTERYPLRGGVEVMSLVNAMNEVAAQVGE